MRVFCFIFRIILLIFLILLSSIWGVKLLEFIFKYDIKYFFQSLFLLGAMIYLIIFIFFIRKRIFIWDTLEHELTHALFAMLTFNSIDSISAGKGGGEVRYSGKGRNVFITLSPYFFPTVLIFLLPIKLLISKEFYSFFDILAGFIFGYYIFSTIKEAHFRQPDLHVFGVIYSYLFIISVNIIIMGSIFFIELFGFQEFLNFWRTVWSTFNIFLGKYI